MWKVGTRVRIIKSERPGSRVGAIGTVVFRPRDRDDRFIVEFDEDIDGNYMTTLYDCKPRCWWWFDDVPGRVTETDQITIERRLKRKNNFY